jgi:hypothetical protein
MLWTFLTDLISASVIFIYVGRKQLLRKFIIGIHPKIENNYSKDVQIEQIISRLTKRRF